MMFRKFLILVLLLQIAGCASIQPSTPKSGSVPAKTSRGPAETPADTPSSAVATLINESRTLRKSGDYPGAATVIERALRIDSGSPFVWLEFAQIRLAQRDFTQAQTLARKALTLAQGNKAIEQSATRIIQQTEKEL